MTEITKKFSESIVTLVNRNTLTVTGVEKVVSANENQISLTVGQSPMTISGSGLTVQKLDVENGTLKIIGCISSIKYDEKKERFLKRIFK